MPLNDIIGRVIDLFSSGTSIDLHKAATTAFPLVRDDDEAIDECIRETVTTRIKNRATKALRGQGSADDGQLSFFGDKLRRRYALDIDGRVIKETSSMTRLEFERLISIREKQLRDDASHLDVLRQARGALGPLWDKFPEATYGEVEQMFIRLSAGSAAA